MRYPILCSSSVAVLLLCSPSAFAQPKAPAAKAPAAKQPAAKPPAAKPPAAQPPAAKPPAAKPPDAPPDETPEPVPEGAIQVLVIPIAGELPPSLGTSPQPFTDALLELTRSTGSRPVEARVGKAEIIAITGCTAESRECFDAVAETVEVDQLVFGSVDPEPPADGTAAVTVTLVKPAEQSYETRRLVLRSETPDQALVEFQTQARAFLAGEPEPAPEPEPALVAPPVVTSGGGRVRPYTYAVVGGGVAMAVAGVVLLGAAQSKQDQVDSAPTDTAQQLDELARLESSGQRLNNWGNGLVIAGGVITAAGMALFIKQRYLDAAPEAPAPIAITPILGRDRGLTITFGGAF